MTISRERFLLIDVLKIMTLVAITVLHTNEFVFYKDIFPLGASSPVWYAFSFYARFFTIGGQILVSIIYLLFGFSGKSKKNLLLIALFSILGQLTLAVIFQSFEWDIYVFLAVTNVLLLLPAFYKLNIYALIISFLFLIIPPDFFQSITPNSPFWNILTGKMSDYSSGSWPLLPWFFLSLLFYQIGLSLRDPSVLRVFYPAEKFIWPFLFLGSLPFASFYYWTPIGPHFYQFAFGQDQHIFWSNFIYFLFLMRLSVLTSLQNKVKQSKLVNFISNLYWVRHLGLSYLLSIIYLGIGMNFSEHFERSPWIFDLFFLSLMPVAEMTGRFLVFIVKSRK